jgi:hypothetical protein
MAKTFMSPYAEYRQIFGYPMMCLPAKMAVPLKTSPYYCLQDDLLVPLGGYFTSPLRMEGAELLATLQHEHVYLNISVDDPLVTALANDGPTTHTPYSLTGGHNWTLVRNGHPTLFVEKTEPPSHPFASPGRAFPVLFHPDSIGTKFRTCVCLDQGWTYLCSLRPYVPALGYITLYQWLELTLRWQRQELLSVIPAVCGGPQFGTKDRCVVASRQTIVLPRTLLPTYGDAARDRPTPSVNVTWIQMATYVNHLQCPRLVYPTYNRSLCTPEAFDRYKQTVYAYTPPSLTPPSRRRRQIKI